MTILVVDDSLMIRKKMQAMLEELGHSVILARNGEESIKIYKEKRPDIVTMDVSMPIMNGMDALKCLMEINSYVKVIMSTANAFSDLVLLAMEEGASGYIVKPIIIETLKDAINKVTEDIKRDEEELFGEKEKEELSNEDKKVFKDIQRKL